MSNYYRMYSIKPENLNKSFDLIKLQKSYDKINQSTDSSRSIARTSERLYKTPERPKPMNIEYKTDLKNVINQANKINVKSEKNFAKTINFDKATYKPAVLKNP